MASKRGGEKSSRSASSQPVLLLETENLTKDYPGVRALDDVGFELRAGEVHVLFGENGAGKSTLISMIAGANTPTSGSVRFRGEPIELDTVHEARSRGISAVFQEFSLIPNMTVAENLFLGAEQTRGGLLRKRELNRKAKAILEELEFSIRPEQRVDHLTRAEQQMVEIAKAFRSDLSVLVLDEPTASLTNHETEHLFQLIEKLKKQGVGIIYITHRMAEIRAIGDRITVLRDGRYIGTVDAKSTSEDELVRLMTGRVVGAIFPTIAFSPGETILETQNLCTTDGQLNGASITVRRGEIVGLAGLVGSGKSHVGLASFGASEVEAGSILLNGEDVTNRSCRDLLDRGLIYLPADRRNDGLMMMRPARENICLASLASPPVSNGWWIDKRAEVRSANDLADRLNLSPNRVERVTDHFSGGNQQKIMLARCLLQSFDVVILDEPTVGVDVGTRSAIYGFIAELCGSGSAVVLISSDLPEILHLSARVYVFYRGLIQGEFEGDEITETNVLSRFFEKDAA